MAFIIKYDVPPETILSHSYFAVPESLRFYRDKKPGRRNRTRRIRNLAELEAAGKLESGFVTQNIDEAPSGGRKQRVVYELHGSTHTAITA